MTNPIRLDNDSGGGDGNSCKVHWVCSSNGKTPTTCRGGGSEQVPSYAPSHGSSSVPLRERQDVLCLLGRRAFDKKLPRNLTKKEWGQPPVRWGLSPFDGIKNIEKQSVLTRYRKMRIRCGKFSRRIPTQCAVDGGALEEGQGHRRRRRFFHPASSSRGESLRWRGDGAWVDCESETDFMEYSAE